MFSVKIVKSLESLKKEVARLKREIMKIEVAQIHQNRKEKALKLRKKKAKKKKS